MRPSTTDNREVELICRAIRATSPADSLASASAFATSKAVQPQTARQLAAAANKAKKVERADDSDDGSDEGELYYIMSMTMADA